ncbi:glycosyltransferase family 2 protein [Xanthomonas campestris]|uniref:glycosyltransferase n=1 Tax=Xanthomonas campestris TaxID=339 RepID=UPI001E380972|nr:glycosyltransferase family 2 protein [Xanthomonas campestris]MCC5062647.1 glycosyltransferase family 2 protein [Xanthomonas campestris pv. raphani]MEA9889495.1 glycosyltransferase family 2 protein [Xanthomonas campestris pv. raphani]MEA9974140.1 glycosyltransferase family 2 protein [Xanthomonas campestris pv. raphani]
MSTPIALRCALVLETNNLRGGDAAHNAVLESLQRAVAALAAQTLPLTALAQLIVTHDGLSETACAALSGIAGRPVTFVRIAPTTGYYDAKNSGFAATDPALCDYVIFADADCLPAADWLAELLLPFSTQSQLAAVAGRTSYAATLVGTALTTLDFMYFPSPLQPQATRNFYANNVVFRREIFAAHAYQPLDGVYRAHCQVLGLHLQACGIAVHYAARAHTVHKLPDTRGEALQLRWWRGQDTLGLTPHLVKAYLPASLHWLARSGPVGPLCVLASRLWFSARALNTQDLPPVRGLRRGAALALIAAFSAVDMLGSLAAGLGWRRRRADAQALSYHHS